MIDLSGTLINHSCNANTGIKDNDFRAYDLNAVREIPAAEQLGITG